MELLGLDILSLQGKIILDLGSGVTGRFATDASNRGVDVVSVNPNLLKESNRKLLKGEKRFWREWKEKYNLDWGNEDSVTAIAQELPFKDNSFDMVVSLYSVPLHLPNVQFVLTKPQ